MYEVSSHQINHINYEDDTLMFEEIDKMFIIVILLTACVFFCEMFFFFKVVMLLYVDTHTCLSVTSMSKYFLGLPHKLVHVC